MMYTVSEMAARLGITSSALRYYDKEGLLPFVQRSNGGMRVFTEEDYSWLKLILCLKQAGMQLKDIQKYIQMAMEGDQTIEARLQMFLDQRRKIQQQIEQLQQTLDVVNYKCWYYETAVKAGTTSVPGNMAEEEIPREYREIRKRLRGEE